MERRSLLSLGIAMFLATASGASAQEADASAPTMDAIRTWLTSNLPKYGGFSLNVTADWANVGAFRPISGSNRSVEARHQIRNVVLENCELQYRGELRLRGSREEPAVLEAVLPLGRVDLSLMRIQRYVLPTELRTTTPRFEVYLRAVAASEGFTVRDQDRRTLNVWEHSIPIDRTENAEQVAETLRQGAKLCGAS